MEPHLAAGGPEALAQMEDAAHRDVPFRLALLDVMMPDMNGFAVAERVRENPRLTGCTMIMLSSAGQTENSVRCEELGIARYLIKPVKQSDLREAILRVLGSQEIPIRVTEPTPAELAHTRRPRRILLAEDGLVNQQVARELLESRGHRVVVVSNGREAVEAIERESFDHRADGCTDAGNGRLRGDRDHPPTGTAHRKPHPHCRHAGTCDEGRSRAVPEVGDGRLFVQADPVSVALRNGRRGCRHRTRRSRSARRIQLERFAHGIHNGLESGRGPSRRACGLAQADGGPLL